MLTCHACMRRCLQTIVGTPAQRNAFSSISTLRGPKRSLQRKLYEPFPNPASSSARNVSQQDNDGASAPDSRKSLSPTRFEKNRQEWFKARGVRPATKARKPNFDNEVALRKHLQYLQDPVKLSDYIRNMLRADDFETAEKVVQYASKTMQCIVSWNHLVDWQLSKGQMNAAIKTFNDMKKRAQTPDAYTYTIIFKGCAEHKDSTQALQKVLAIYHSMSADKCPVKPNIIHVNAVLRMCARAGDMDAMFAIADHLPEKGIRAPNNLTYTTILNGLRLKLLPSRSSETSLQQQKEARNLILTARHIWSDIIRRWRAGDIWIDEELVCAMGRLLLMGDERDADDILSLVEQTMSIPRQFSPKAAIAPPDADQDTTQSISQPFKVTVASENGVSSASLNSSSTGNSEEDAVIPFTELVTPKAQPPKGVSPYPLPGRNTLSLIMTALQKLRSHTSPKPYWTFLTSPPHSIIPDAENHASYLRVLRITRSSTATVAVLSSMPKDHMTHGTFRIAMSTCLRDKNNPNAFANAGKILDYMQSGLTTPDAQVLEAYLELAITTPIRPVASGTVLLPGQDEKQANKLVHGRMITRALHRLTPCYVSLRTTLTHGDELLGVLDGRARQHFTQASVQLASRMVGAYDMLLNMGMVEHDYYASSQIERGRLAAFITRTKHNRLNSKQSKQPEFKTITISKAPQATIAEPSF